jgi:hypothetical protein
MVVVEVVSFNDWASEILYICEEVFGTAVPIASFEGIKSVFCRRIGRSNLELLVVGFVECMESLPLLSGEIAQQKLRHVMMLSLFDRFQSRITSRSVQHFGKQ